MELALPVVPDSMRNPEERAAFVAEHFWDSLDFARDSRSLDTAFMEQNFVNFQTLLAVTPEAEAQKAVSRLLKRASEGKDSGELLGYVADRYLDDPNSPMGNEELYILFAREWINDSSTPVERRVRADFRLKQAMKNRVGTKGNDFTFIGRDGKSHRLHRELGDSLTLLMFYDPDCQQCSEVKNKMIRTPVRKDMKIIAVDVTGDRERWESSKEEFPDDWMVGIAVDRIEEEEIYVIRALPSIYLFDGEGMILIKDSSFNKLIG
nr:hypothetical protein Muribac2_110 [uncultured Muribaculaceae bacterium]